MIYTDFLDKPIAVGDEIVYAVAGYRGGGSMQRGVILNIIDLLPHRSGVGGYMRADQAKHANPTKYNLDLYKDPTKRFKVQVEVPLPRWTNAGTFAALKKLTLPHSNSIIVL